MLLQKSTEKVLAKKFETSNLTMRFCKWTGKKIEFLRLPVGHSELNPIEFIWTFFKSDEAMKSNTFKTTDIKNQ